MKKLIILLVLAVLGVGGAFWYWRGTAKPAATFRTAAVERGDLLTTINATGTVEPEEVVDVGAQVAGQIKNFGRDPRDSSRAIDYGSPVEEGTVLAQIDDALYLSQVNQAKANLQRAEADMQQFRAKVAQTERDWNRSRALLPSSATTQEENDAARAAYETAKSSLGVGDAAVAQAKAALQQAETNLGYCTIKSPVKGVIVDRRVNVGQTVVSSLNSPSLFLIAKDLKRLQVWASVNEADVGHIHSGQAVTFSVDAFAGEVFQGVVAPDQPRLNASMTQNVVTYTVVVNTDNSSGKLVPYLTANLQFEVSRHENALLVPNAALNWTPRPDQVAKDARGGGHQKPSGWAEKEHPDKADKGTLWVEDNGFVRPVRVRVGASDGVRTEIVGGDLKEGDAVVVGESRPEGDGGAASNPFTPQLFGGRKPQQ
jgi:HlyD family secretion protein